MTNIDFSPVLGIITKARKAGIRFYLENEKIRFGVPKDCKIEKELLDEIREYRDDIKTILTGDNVWFDEKELLQIVFPDHQEIFDITIHQKKVYLKFLMLGDSSFNVSFNIKVESLDKALLEQTLKLLTARHESLRTTFVTVQGQLKQLVHRIPPTYPKIRYVQAADIEKGGDTKKVYLECMTIRFNLQKGPLLDVLVVEYTDGSSVIFFTTHHAVSDDISSRILEREFSRLYYSGCKESLPVLKLQYKEYAAWVSAFRESDKFRSGKVQYLDKIKASLSAEARTLRSYRAELKQELESVLGNTAVEHYENALGTMANINPKPGASYISFIPKELLGKAKTLAIACDSSLFMTLMSAFALFFMKQRKNDVLRVGITFNTRVFEELTKILGWFTGDAIACIETDKDQTIYQFIKSSTASMLDVSKYRFYPYEQIINELDVPLDILIPIQLSLIHKTEMTYHDLTPMHLTPGYNHYSFKCNLIEFSNCVLMKTDYNLETYSKEGVEQAMEEYKSLISWLSDTDVRSTKLSAYY